MEARAALEIGYRPVLAAATESLVGLLLDSNYLRFRSPLATNKAYDSQIIVGVASPL